VSELRSANEIPYTVRRSSRARRVRVNVHAHAGVEVVLPARAPERAAAAAVRELRPWIERRLGEAHEALARVAARAGTLPFLDDSLALVAQPGRTRVHRDGGRLLVPEHEPRPAIERFYRRAARAEIAPRLDKLRHQFVHNDFSVRNIIVDPHEESRVVGIIDFGDAVHTGLICDVAIGATGQLAMPETANEAVHDFVEAYCQVEPLQKEELALLKWLIAGRIVLNVVLTAWRRIENRCSGHIDGFDSAFFGWRIDFAKRLVYSPVWQS